MMQTVPPSPRTSGLRLGETLYCKNCRFPLANRLLDNPGQLQARYKGGAFHWPVRPWTTECPRCFEEQVVR